MNQRFLHNRRIIRKANFNYSKPGIYFVTINTYNKRKLLGSLTDSGIQLSKFGEIVETVWNTMPGLHVYLKLDEYVVMPNHFHALLHIKHNIESCPNGGVSSIVRDFKSSTTRKINELRQTPGGRVWQRSYWDKIVYDTETLCRIREYIKTNPRR